MSHEINVKRSKGINLLHPPLLKNMLGSWNLSKEQFHTHFVAIITIMLQYDRRKSIWKEDHGDKEYAKTRSCNIASQKGFACKFSAAKTRVGEI